MGYHRGTISDTADEKMANDYDWSNVPFPRRIIGICVTGGTAANDARLEVYAGSRLIGILRNYTTDTALVNPATNFVACSLYVPAGATIGAICREGATGGTLYLHLLVQPTRQRLSTSEFYGMVVMKNVTAATCALDFDFADDESQWNSDTNPRILSAMALVGSAVKGDTRIECSIGSQFFSELFNTDGGASTYVPSGSDFYHTPQYIGRNKVLEFKVVDAATTNEICLGLVFSRYNRAVRNR